MDILINKIRNIFIINSKNIINWISLIILIIAIVSFFHVYEYWLLTNASSYAYLTAAATECLIILGILTINYSRVGFLVLGLGILIQGIANIFYTHLHLNIQTNEFHSFIELFKPIFQSYYGSEGNETELAINSKRTLSMFNGITAYIILPLVLMFAQWRLRTKKEKSILQDSTTAETPVNPVSETPAVELPVAELPVAELPVAESPVVESPVVESPVAESPVAELPVAELPVAELPVAETPVVESPVVESPVAETPAVEIATTGETAIVDSEKIIEEQIAMKLADMEQALNTTALDEADQPKNLPSTRQQPVLRQKGALKNRIPPAKTSYL